MNWLRDHAPVLAGWITASVALLTLVGKVIADYIGLHRRMDLLRHEFDQHVEWSAQRNQLLEGNQKAIGAIMLSLSNLDTLRQEDLKQRQQLDEERRERHRELIAEIKTQGDRFEARLLELHR